MNDKDKDALERMEKTRDTLLTIRTVLWTIAGVIIFGLMGACLIHQTYYSGGR